MTKPRNEPSAPRKPAAHTTTRLRLRVTATAETIVRSGHPWLFAESVREQNREGQMGELAVIYDRKDEFLAIGLFDPQSPIRVRILHAGKPQTINDAWWQQRLQSTLAKRRGLFDEHTNGWRWINGESDGWPGLVLDRYDTTLVLKIYTAIWLPRLQEIVALIQSTLSPARIILRLSRNIQELAEKEFQRRDGDILIGTKLTQSVVFRENGILFEADVLRGQKTGFFLDQRENRQRVGTLASGRDVLNAFSFSGGFSLYAARGGAKSVTDLDISSYALVSAKKNFALNKTDKQVAACQHKTIQADAFEWLAGNLNAQFDLIVLDPPSLAKREAERAGAIQAYEKLAANGIRHLRSGGVLVAASCSAHVSADEFFNAARRMAVASGRRFAELATTRHAPDHHASFKEAEYLKCVYMQFHT